MFVGAASSSGPSFETPAAQAPQDEVSCWFKCPDLILRACDSFDGPFETLAPLAPQGEVNT